MSFSVSLSSLVSTGQRFVSSVQQVNESKENVGELSKGVAQLKAIAAYPVTTYNAVAGYVSRQLTSGIAFTLGKIPGVNDFYEERCNAIALSCTKKCLSHASKLSTYIPKDNGIVQSFTDISSKVTNASSKSWYDSYLGSGPLASVAAAVTDYAVGSVVSNVAERYDPRKPLAKKLFLPLVYKLNQIAVAKVVNSGVNIAAFMALNYATGGLDFNAHLIAFQETTSLMNRSASAAKLGIHAYVYGKPLVQGAKFGIQSCLKRRQIKKIDEALSKIDLQPLIASLTRFSGGNIPYIDQAAKPIAKAVIIALIDCGMLGSLDFAALVGNKKALNVWLARNIEVLIALTAENKP